MTGPGPRPPDPIRRMRKPQAPGAYVRVTLRRPIENPFGGGFDRVLPIESEDAVEVLEDGALLIRAHWPARIETFHFPPASVNFWSTFSVTEEQYAQAMKDLEEAIVRQKEGLS